MLVTEKPTGTRYIVMPEGKQSPAVAGLPRVDGRGQGGLLDVELGPDCVQSRLISWTYDEPRECPHQSGWLRAQGQPLRGPQGYPAGDLVPGPPQHPVGGAGRAAAPLDCRYGTARR